MMSVHLCMCACMCMYGVSISLYICMYIVCVHLCAYYEARSRGCILCIVSDCVPIYRGMSDYVHVCMCIIIYICVYHIYVVHL